MVRLLNGLEGAPKVGLSFDQHTEIDFIDKSDLFNGWQGLVDVAFLLDEIVGAFDKEEGSEEGESDVGDE